MNEEDKNLLTVKASATADELYVNEAAIALLARGSHGLPCLADWGEPEARITGSAGTDFLRVAGFPTMLAFRCELTHSTGLEMYLDPYDLGEYLPVRTERGRFYIWHLLSAASTNMLDRTCIDDDGGVRYPRFHAHRVPIHWSVYTAPEFRNTHIFLTIQNKELPSVLGGSPVNDHPPLDCMHEDWRCFPLEYIWRGWTGLDFQLFWREESSPPN